MAGNKYDGIRSLGISNKIPNCKENKTDQNPCGYHAIKIPYLHVLN